MWIWLYEIRAFFYVLFLVLVVNCCVLTVECIAGDKQLKIVTRHTRLVFNSTDDVVKFNAAINFPSGSSFASLFGASKSTNVQQELVRKVDLLFEKVQLILDMRKEMRKIRIKLFSNRQQLRQAYIKIYGRDSGVRGWYVYDFNTVYLNVSEVHEGMLAHELGHAIIDNFLTVRPPRATAEILARYVDKHLFEEVRQY